MAKYRNSNIGVKLYKLRNDKHLKQEYVADCIGVARQTLSKWESNQSSPKLDNIILLAELFGVTVEYLTNDAIPVDQVEKYKSADENIVACEEVPQDDTQIAQKDEVQEIVTQEEKKSKRNKLSKKAKIMIIAIVLAVVMLVGIAMIIFGKCVVSFAYEGEFDLASLGQAWNFSVDNLGWIVFGVALSLAIVLGIVLIIDKVKHKKFEKEQMAMSNI